jgi:hypothetical protein
MTQAMTMQQAKSELMAMKFDGMLEQEVFNHWRDNEPKKVEALMMKRELRKAISDQTNALILLRRQLQKTENLDPAMARMEAWNRLMRITEDATAEAKAWGMTTEDYQNRD